MVKVVRAVPRGARPSNVPRLPGGRFGRPASLLSSLNLLLIVLISGYLNSETYAATLTNLSLTPSTVTSGNTFTVHVHVSDTSFIEFSLLSDNSAVPLNESVQRSGAYDYTFKVPTNEVSTLTYVNITAKIGSLKKTRKLKLIPPPGTPTNSGKQIYRLGYNQLNSFLAQANSRGYGFSASGQNLNVQAKDSCRFWSRGSTDYRTCTLNSLRKNSACECSVLIGKSLDQNWRIVSARVRRDGAKIGCQITKNPPNQSSTWQNPGFAFTVTGGTGACQLSELILEGPANNSYLDALD